MKIFLLALLRGKILKIYPVLKLTFKEILKEKIFSGIVILDVLFCVGSYYLSEISAGDNVKIAEDFILSFQFFIITIFSILITTSSFYKDFKEKVIYLILSKPVEKKDYLLGRISGLLAALSSLSFILYLINTSAILIINKISHLYVPRIIVTERTFLFSVLLVFMGLLIITVTTLLYMLFTSHNLILLSSFLIFIIGLELSPARELVYASRFASDVTKLIVKVSYYLLPNYSLFDIKSAVVYYELSINPLFVTGTIVYALLYSLFLFFSSLQILERKEF